MLPVLMAGSYFKPFPSLPRESSIMPAMSIGVDRSQVPPVLRINGHVVQWEAVTTLSKENRKEIRSRLKRMPNGSKLVAYTMAGAVLPMSDKDKELLSAVNRFQFDRLAKEYVESFK